MPPVRDCTASPEAGKPNRGHATAPRPCYLGVGGNASFIVGADSRVGDDAGTWCPGLQFPRSNFDHTMRNEEI